MNESPHSQQIDLRTLIGHTIALQAEGKLEDIYQLFGKHNIAFIAVLENEQVIGMCSRWQIGMLLGSRYGFSLFSRKPVRDHLLPDALRVSAQSPIASVLEKVASRSEETFLMTWCLWMRRSFLGMADLPKLAVKCGVHMQFFLRVMLGGRPDTKSNHLWCGNHFAV
jgi:hypothetical protein